MKGIIFLPKISCKEKMENKRFKRLDILLALIVSTFVSTLAIIVFSLNITILKSTLQTASIALPQLDHADGVSMHGIYIGVIVVGVFQLIAIFIPCCLTIGRSDSFLIGNTVVLSSITCILIIIPESLTFKFISCFNYSNNHMVKARSSLAICLMLLIIFIIFYSWFRSQVRLSEYFNWLIKLSFCLFLIIPCLVVLALNIVLLVRLKPELTQKIDPSNIYMGFFNQSEIISIQKGDYVKDNYFSERIVGKLSDIINSELKKSRTRCYTTYKSDKNGYETDTTCVTNYTKYYFFKIDCANNNSLFLEDCSTNSSIVVSLYFFTYEDDFQLTSEYPNYNCLINSVNQTCNQTCTNLLSKYELIMFQLDKNSVGPAWKDFNNCKGQPSIRLILNKNFTACSYSFANFIYGDKFFICLCLILMEFFKFN